VHAIHQRAAQEGDHTHKPGIDLYHGLAFPLCD
jgi:hypothetical protein